MNPRHSIAKKILRWHLILCLTGLMPYSPVAAATAPPSPCGAVPTERQVDWLRMEWYAFVHFGINTFTGKEWGYGDESPELFNPSGFDPESAVKVFKEAGMAGMIYTAKHHDGFCLWPTKSTTHNITKSRWMKGKGDIVKGFADACKKEGIKFGAYLSPWDRNNAEYGRPGYLKTYEKQIRELLTDYGPIFEMWFDGANGGDGYYGGTREKRDIGNDDKYYNFEGVVKLIRSIQPDCIVWGAAQHGDVKWGGSEKGFVKYPCWNVINLDKPDEKWISLEADTTINKAGWFWHAGQGSKVKSPEQLMQVYYDSVGRGANLILNLAMDRSGKLDPADVAALNALAAMRHKLLAQDFAIGSEASASEVRGEDDAFRAANATDGNIESYWCPEDKTTKDCWLEIRLPKKATFDVVRLREQIRLGQRVRSFRLEAFLDGNWQIIDGEGKTIGNQVLRKLAKPVTADRVRLVITDSRACPCISEFSLLRHPDPVAVDAASLQCDASEETAASLSRDKWTSEMTGASKAWDGDDSTFWQGKGNELTVNLGEEVSFSGFTYLPKQNGNFNGMTDRYRFEVSSDGEKWKEVASGEFPNIRANPILQTVTFDRGVTARFFRFIGASSLEGKGASAAEINLLK